MFNEKEREKGCKSDLNYTTRLLIFETKSKYLKIYGKLKLL